MFPKSAENSRYELAVAVTEPKLQLPIAKAINGCAHLLVRSGATSREIRQAIGTALNSNRSDQVL